MGWLPVSLALVASALLYDTGHPVLLTLAIGSAVGCFWSRRIMHNYATEAAKRRSSYDGGFYDITEEEADSVPNWITYWSMCFSALALLAFVSALVVATARFYEGEPINNDFIFFAVFIFLLSLFKKLLQRSWAFIKRMFG